MAKRDAMTKRAALPRRVTEAASSAGLGAWTSTEEADSAGGASIWFICGIGAPVLAAQVVIPLSVVAAHALSEPGGQWGAWSLIVVSCILSLVALIAAFVLCHVGAGIVRRGRLMLHLHEFGFVLERTKGRVAAARFDETRAELLVYENSSENSPRPWDEYQVMLTLPDGSVAAIDIADGTTLMLELAAACGAPDRRRVSIDGAVELRHAQEWGVRSPA